MLKRVMPRFFFGSFLSHMPKNAVGECFSLSLVSDLEKVWMSGWCGGECHDFPWIFSCLTVPKKFVGEPFGVSLFSGIENFYAQEGFVTIFSRVFFCLTVPKNAVGESFSHSIISDIEEVWMRGW